MKIVVLDGNCLNPGDLSWEKLHNLGECVVYGRTMPHEVLSRAVDADALIINKIVVDRALMAQLPRLKYVGVTATGYNVVDVKEASLRNIAVTNIPAYSTDSVAQMVFAHILNVTNRVELHSDSVRSGEWARAADFSYTKSHQLELTGKTLGIVGFGNIGQRVAEIGKAFGMKVIFYNRTPKTGQPSSIEQKSLESVFAESDFVSLNCALSPDNVGFVNSNLLKTMKQTAVLVNTGRGGLIAEQDLADALNSGQIAAACLDVLSTEPPAADNPLLSARNCFITPHIAWATTDARQRLLDITIENLEKFIEGCPQNVVS